MTNDKYKVSITGDAQLNISSIENYLIKKDAPHELALKKVVQIVRETKKLNILPNRYPTVEQRYGLPTKKNYRVMPIDNYVAFYKIDYHKNIDYVQRILNQSTNIKEYIIDHMSDLFD